MSEPVKLSADTLSVFSMLSNITDHLYLPAGSGQMYLWDVPANSPTNKPTKAIVSEVQISDIFPGELCIGGLRAFCRVLGVFKTPVIEHKGTYLFIANEDGTSTLRYQMTAKQVMAYRTEPVKFESSGVSCLLDTPTLAELSKMYGALGGKDGVPHLMIEPHPTMSGKVAVSLTNCSLGIKFDSSNKFTKAVSGEFKAKNPIVLEFDRILTLPKGEYQLTGNALCSNVRMQFTARTALQTEFFMSQHKTNTPTI
jgi:hypothetical protein